MTSRHTELVVGLLGLSLTVLVFLLWPGLDVWVSNWFFDPELRRFTATHWPWVLAIHEGFPGVMQGLFVLSLMAWAGSWRFSHVVSRAWRRRLAAWMLLVILGIGVVVDWAFKDNVGRPRPEQIEVFAGDLPFIPVLQTSNHCDLNCSFVSGHAAGAFSLMAWGMWAPWHRRKRWLSLGIGLGLAIGLMRIAQGGHFLSDVLFAGWTIWLIEQSLRRVWLYQRCRQLRICASKGMR
jgi:lipid A 4'-phosphatase